MSAIKQRRVSKRYKRMLRIMRKHITNSSHAPRLRASKHVYNTQFSIDNILQTDRMYILNIAIFGSERFLNLLDTTIGGTGPITYEATIGL